MKKIYISTVILTLCFSGCLNFNPKKNEPEKILANPQDDMAMAKSNHLKFKGVPIDGKLKEFVSRMERKGFKHVGTTDDIEILQGDFAGFKECTIYVTTLDNQDLVSRISVVFPEQDQWGYLYGDYKHLKELLTEKYGKPSACTEKFQSHYDTTQLDDQDKIHNVKFDRCKYETRFTVNNGEIILWIEHDSLSSCFVMLSYKDQANTNVIREYAKDDL